jgi:virginiamycin A acetyltransferase
MKRFIRRVIKKILRYADLSQSDFSESFKRVDFSSIALVQTFNRSWVSDKAKVYPPFSLTDSNVGDYSYIAQNAILNLTTIGKFCSIGPNLMSGYGIHPLHGISTSPMFYSTIRQNGITLSSTDKFQEVKKITIGNDVFIGMNVTILDGVSIGDGAVIAAGAVVVNDVPSYTVVGGCPAKFIKRRLPQDTAEKLAELKWWDWDLEKLKTVEENFFDVQNFISLSEK